jgi:2,3-bisphosphoglycerate-independent phosphoglycerate mutase
MFAAGLPRSVPIATICGRYFAMDRDRRWERVAKAYALIADGTGERFEDVGAVITDAYARDTTDEFIRPAVIGNYRGARDGDAVVCFNFRSDRVRQLLSALLLPDFDAFPRVRPVRFAAALGMTHYSAELDHYLDAVFPAQEMANLLGQVVAAAGRRQLRMAETEKYPHVTYFLNGGDEDANAGEDRIMVPSPKVATYDLQPEMSAPELTGRAIAAIRGGEYDLIVLNYANPDMVGHTGSLEAAIAAVEAVDTGLGHISKAIAEAGGALLVTADHGNCELMRDPETGAPHTAHTLNPVPVLLQGRAARLRNGRLADLAPTLLDLMGLAQPAEMTGRTLIL